MSTIIGFLFSRYTLLILAVVIVAVLVSTGRLLLNKFTIGGLLALALGIGAWTGIEKWAAAERAIGAQSVQKKWDSEKLSVAAQSLKLSEQATRTTVDLQTKADKALESKNAKIKALNTAVATVLASLHDRPDRPAGGGVPEAASSGGGCYPSQLYREDSAVVIKLAAEADQLRIAIGNCQAAYSAAREALK